MTNSDKYGRMREITLNEPVTITLPAHVWCGFLAAYVAAKWSCADASVILNEVQNALFDPLWLRERQAEVQRVHDERHRLISGITGFPGPMTPPDAGDLT